MDLKNILLALTTIAIVVLVAYILTKKEKKCPSSASLQRLVPSCPPCPPCKPSKSMYGSGAAGGSLDKLKANLDIMNPYWLTGSLYKLQGLPNVTLGNLMHMKFIYYKQNMGSSDSDAYCFAIRDACKEQGYPQSFNIRDDYWTDWVCYHSGSGEYGLNNIVNQSGGNLNWVAALLDWRNNNNSNISLVTYFHIMDLEWLYKNDPRVPYILHPLTCRQVIIPESGDFVSMADPFFINSSGLKEPQGSAYSAVWGAFRAYSFYKKNNCTSSTDISLPDSGNWWWSRYQLADINNTYPFGTNDSQYSIYFNVVNAVITNKN
jgi:hypothetical protein